SPSVPREAIGMGVDDRDYMRERYRDRQKREAAGIVWNDKKARREQDHADRHKVVPLGSANWISGRGGTKGSWFEARNRGHDYQKSRHRTAPRILRKLGWLLLALSVVLAALPAWNSLKREGHLPDFGPAQPFPKSGSVVVSKRLGIGRVTSHLTVTADEANAIVQLIAPESGRHAMSVYVAAHTSVTVPAPHGSYRVRLIEGQKWHGPQRFFGPNTSFETAVELMEFPARGSAGIDLHRRPDGNLKTHTMITSPEAL
ncbi:MAG: hypothetical protein M3Y22_15685, partial [Pseudomonadota bacterium]|nr:hypothetical protein [Pseudomonadota bacterium]